MTRPDTLFVDVGGACLTNGWDTDGRLAAASHCVLDVEETEDWLRESQFMRADRAASLFVDDREENVAGAWAVGLRALHAPEPKRLVQYLRDAGVHI
jgi:hypothetical protein